MTRQQGDMSRAAQLYAVVRAVSLFALLHPCLAEVRDRGDSRDAEVDPGGASVGWASCGLQSRPELPALLQIWGPGSFCDPVCSTQVWGMAGPVLMTSAAMVQRACAAAAGPAARARLQHVHGV